MKSLAKVESALALGPMTKLQIAKSLSLSVRSVEDSLYSLRDHGAAKICGRVRTGKNKPRYVWKLTKEAA